MPPRDADTTVIAVRARAETRVDPDTAILHVAVRGRGAGKSEARAAVHSSLRRITDGLTSGGGVVASPATTDHPLTWQVRSVRTHEDYDDRGRRTGHHEASLDLAVAVRDFDLLATAESAITAVDDADLHGVSWSVDDDNAAWPVVRADAIGAALVKGQDYAAAIGGEVLGIEQVSDAGLLCGGTGIVDDYPGGIEMASAAGFASHGFDGTDDTDGTGDLEPVPQLISATIEARLRATAGSLPAR